MSSTKKLIVGLIGLFLILLVAEYFYHQYALTAKEKQINELYNKIAVKDSLVEVVNNGYEKRAIELQEAQILLNDLRQKKGELASLIKSKDLKIRALINLILKPDTVKIVVSGEETISENNGRKIRVSFDKKIDRIHVWGYTETPPPIAKLNILEDPLELYIILTQGRDKKWRTYIDSPISVSELQTKIVPHIPSFWEQIGFKAGVGCGSRRLMGIVGLEYKRTDFFFFADNHGTAIGITRAWRLR